MADNQVPRSFDELKQRAAEKIRRGDQNVQDDIMEMGDAMLQSGVEAKTPQDKVAKHAWQVSQPHEKRLLADMVARMAKNDSELS
ncbi:MAG: DUF3243 family protein [Clostridia bacterium]|jgi:hypothetical protein